MASLYFISVVFSLIYFMWMRRRLLTKIMELDDKALTPSDYCLMGMHMKFEDYTAQGMKEEITEYFIENYNQLEENIEYINISYNINKYYKLSQRYDEL